MRHPLHPGGRPASRAAGFPLLVPLAGERDPCRGRQRHAGVQSGQSPLVGDSRAAAASRTASACAAKSWRRRARPRAGCLRYELRQADGDADLWLLPASGAMKRPCRRTCPATPSRSSPVLWQALAATLDVQERPF
ncbi:antibiotic biosynthesis monooxygenase [Pseudomonas aeruginosa]|nr:antibiotic biosynthesis monooxygenase [Pseudomonas aeruginosa]